MIVCEDMDISKNEEKYQIQVCVRFKPLSARERNVIQVLYSNGISPTAISICEKQFTVDSVFDANASQECIYRKCIKPLVDGCFQGYNGTIFACKNYLVFLCLVIHFYCFCRRPDRKWENA